MKSNHLHNKKAMIKSLMINKISFFYNDTTRIDEFKK